MIDIDTVPEYFASNVGLIEDAGDGMVRLVYCVSRQSVTTAVCSNVVPAQGHLAILSRRRGRGDTGAASRGHNQLSAGVVESPPVHAGGPILRQVHAFV